MSENISTSSSMDVPSDQDITEMDKLMSDGKRNYVCNQPQLALDCFVKLCEKLSKYYGQESGKCMEAYLYYGKTLLDIARLENGVLGQAIKESPSSDSEVEETGEEKEEKGKTNNGDVKKVATGMEEQKANGPTKVGIESIEGIESDEEEEEDITNMELAWEMFELTTVICKRQLEKEGLVDKKIKSTLAEAKNGLAQVSLETEQYEEAVRDFTESLKLYKELLEDKNDRVIAETHYNIALALSFDKKFSEAIEQFENAASVLKARVEDLETKVKECEEKGGKTEKAPVELEEWKKEIGDLNDLIQMEMMTRIEDAHESKRLLEESIKTVKSAASEMFSAFSGSKNGFDEGFGDSEGFDAPFSGDQVIHDCSNKIKSVKRKNEDEASDVSLKK